MGKIDNKFYGTLGLFISKTELSSNVIKAVSKGRQRKVIILHGNDIVDLIKKEILFKNYIIEAVNAYSTNNIDYFSVTDYLNSKSVDNEIIDNERKISESINDYLKIILVNKNLDDPIIFEQTSKLSREQQKKVFHYYLENIDLYYKKYNDFFSRNYVYLNILHSFKYLKIFNNKKIIELYWGTVISKEDFSLVTPQLWKNFNTSINNEGIDKNKIYDSLIKILKKSKGNWDKENTLTEYFESTWEYLEEEQEKVLLKIYFEIYIDNSRKEKYPQKRFANYLVRSNIKETAKAAFKEWIDDEIEKDAKDLKNEIIDTDMVNRVSSYFYKQYKDFYRLSDCNEEEFKELINVKYYDFVKNKYEIIDA